MDWWIHFVCFRVVDRFDTNTTASYTNFELESHAQPDVGGPRLFRVYFLLPNRVLFYHPMTKKEITCTEEQLCKLS